MKNSLWQDSDEHCDMSPLSLWTEWYNACQYSPKNPEDNSLNVWKIAFSYWKIPDCHSWMLSEAIENFAPKPIKPFFLF